MEPRQKLLLEQVVKRHFGLYVVPIRVAANAVHRYHGKVNGIGRAGILYERLATGLKMQIVLVVDGELTLAVLYFAKVRHSVVTVYHQVYLRPGVAVVRKRTSARKKESVDILRKTLILAQRIPLLASPPPSCLGGNMIHYFLPVKSRSECKFLLRLVPAHVGRD